MGWTKIPLAEATMSAKEEWRKKALDAIIPEEIGRVEAGREIH